MTGRWVVKLIPGFCGALAAFMVLKLTDWALSLTLELVVFIATYLVVAVALEAAIVRYADRERVGRGS